MPRGSKPADDGDESAMLFFFLAMLSCTVLPWGFSVVWGLLFPRRSDVARVYPEQDEKGRRVRHCQTQAMVARREAHVQELQSRTAQFTKGYVFRLVILSLLTCWLGYTVVQVRSVMATSALYQNFDPHEILGVGRKEKSSAIKKAFHKMSLQYHPDKNKDPGAAEKFIMIKKAYDALTDPVARRNYERYGNPDGPTRMEIGVALPTFSKENQGLVLILFVVFFILGVPISLICACGGASLEHANGVMMETMEVLADKIKADMDIRKAQELLLECRENGLFPEREGEREVLEEALKELKPSKASKAGKDDASGRPKFLKAEALLLAHIQRRRDLLPEASVLDLEELLRKWRLVAWAMAEIASKQGFLDAFMASLELHRCVVQALEPGSQGNPLLQVPHLSADRCKALKKGPRKNLGLPSFLDLSAEERSAGLKEAGYEPQEIADVDEFALVAPRVSITSATVFVDGEEGICIGDIATLRVTFKRNNLKEDEALTLAHTPLFPRPVPEGWWVVFSMPGSKNTRGATRFEKTLEGGHEVTEEIKFKVSTLGKKRCKVSLFCEAYAGLDADEKDITFEAKEDDGGQGQGGDDDEGSELALSEEED